VVVLRGVYRRGNTVQIVRAQLESPEAIERVKASLEHDPRVNVTVRSERAFYADQSRILLALIKYVGTTLAVLMGIGAVFAALNTMYSAVSSRTREIATLRALGFGTGPVVFSVLIESIVLALAGGAIGAGLAYAAFDGFTAATINFQTFSQVTFAFAVTPALLVQAVVWAVTLGILGGLLPAIRAARLPIAAGLRES
jgi:putative ABC transport system permease protein